MTKQGGCNVDDVGGNNWNNQGQESTWLQTHEEEP
jgi:hypothetical protein